MAKDELGTDKTSDIISTQDEEDQLKFLNETLKTSLTTARILLEKEFQDPLWVVDGLIPEGFSILAGKPKSGKSWLSLHLAASISYGTRFLSNFTVNRNRCLYLALEDNDRRLKKRLEAIQAFATHELLITTKWQRAGGTGALANYLGGSPDIKTVIIDTLGAFMPLQDFNAYAEVYQALDNLKTLCEQRGVNIIAVHHTRKSSSTDFLDNISGSNAFTGVADTIIELTRGRGDADGFLRLVGRDIDDIEIALQLVQDEGWKFLGKGSEYRMEKERRAIVEVLKEADGEMSPNEITAVVEGNSGAVRKLLSCMVNDGQIIRVRRGLYAYREI